jgi:hypothetical protein
MARYALLCMSPALPPAAQSKNYAVSMFVRTKGVYIHGFQGRISWWAACGKAGGFDALFQEFSHQAF